MKHPKTSAWMAATACMAIAGLMPAQSGEQSDRTKAAPADKAAPPLIKAETILGAEVRDKSHAKVGSIKDLCVDTKTGTIVFAIVSSGGVLGVGDKERVVAIDLRAVDAETKKVTLNMTKDELEKAPPYDAKNLEEHHRRFAQAKPGGAKPVAEAGFARSGERTIKGKVVAVDRSGSDVLVDIGESGKEGTCRVNLGGDGHLKTQSCDPKVGDAIEVVVLDSSKGEGTPATLVAASVRCGDKNVVQIRDAAGRTAPAERDAPPCCALMSDLDDAKVLCDKDKVGSVGEALVDPASACLAYFTLSTDDFGEKANYIIPWRAAWLDKDQAVHLKATKDQMKTAPRLAKDTTGWTDPAFLRRVDEFYATVTDARASKQPGKGEDR